MKCKHNDVVILDHNMKERHNRSPPEPTKEVDFSTRTHKGQHQQHQQQQQQQLLQLQHSSNSYRIFRASTVVATEALAVCVLQARQ